MAYRIDIKPAAKRHLSSLRKRDQVIILNAVNQQLSDQPTAEARNRKRLRPNPLAEWELRVGTFRVLYNVEQPDELVVVAAVGIKVRNVLLIEGEEFAPCPPST